MGSAAQDWGVASEMDDVSGQVAIVGVGESEHSKASGRSSQEIAAQAIERALEDAGIEPDQVDGIMYSRGVGDQFDEFAFREHFGVDRELWVSHQGGGMTWAATAPHSFAHALREKKASIVVNVFSVDWGSQKGREGGSGPGQFHGAERIKANFELPFGWFPQPVYFATIARRHMWQYGTRAEDLGAIAVQCRRHANTHPTAVMRDKPLSLDDYLNRPMLVDPLRIDDCCLISDGGGAYVMTSLPQARDLRKEPIVVAGVGEGRSGSGLYWSQQGDFTATPQIFSAPQAFTMAGITPQDVDVLTLYDPFTIAALMQIEDMGFCRKGEAGPFVAGTNLQFDTEGLAYNTHGGLLSHAYVLGIAHVVELVRQLRGEATNQVRDAVWGVYGGYTGHMASTLVLRRGA